MENYLKFTLPDIIDLRMSIIWLCVGVVVLSAFLFLLWKKEKPRNIYPRLTLIAAVLGIIGIPGIIFGGEYLNETKMVESIETNYGVEVVNQKEDSYLISSKGEIYSCEIYEWQEESYYVLCEVPNGRLLLNDIVAKNK